MRVLIKVTEDDIAFGKRGSCGECPIAKALIRQLGWLVNVTISGFIFRGISEARAKTFSLELSRNITHFDKTGQMVPFEFEVELEEPELQKLNPEKVKACREAYFYKGISQG
jgi:hypothetical protein